MCAAVNYDRSVLDLVCAQIFFEMHSDRRDVCRATSMVTYSYMTSDRAVIDDRLPEQTAAHDQVTVGDERHPTWEEDT